MDGQALKYWSIRRQTSSRDRKKSRGLGISLNNIALLVNNIFKRDPILNMDHKILGLLLGISLNNIAL